MNIGLSVPTKNMLRVQEIVKESGCHFSNLSRDYMTSYIGGNENATTYISIIAPTPESYVKFNELWERANVTITEKDSRPNMFQKIIRRIKLFLK